MRALVMATGIEDEIVGAFLLARTSKLGETEIKRLLRKSLGKTIQDVFVHKPYKYDNTYQIYFFMEMSSASEVSPHNEEIAKLFQEVVTAYKIKQGK